MKFNLLRGFLLGLHAMYAYALGDKEAIDRNGRSITDDDYSWAFDDEQEPSDRN